MPLFEGAIYARESSADTTKAPPIALQIERGYEYFQSLGIDKSKVRVYADDGYSGGDWTRPEWNQCVKDARRHLWQHLWTWNQDRLARDTEQFLWFYRNLKDSDVHTIWEATSNSKIEMETLGDRVKHQSLAQAAEIFRMITSDKVKKVYNQKKLNGQRWGRKPLLSAEQIASAQQLRNVGFGFRRIATQLGVNYQTVRRALLNRVI